MTERKLLKATSDLERILKKEQFGLSKPTELDSIGNKPDVRDVCYCVFDNTQNVATIRISSDSITGRLVENKYEQNFQRIMYNLQKDLGKKASLYVQKDVDDTMRQFVSVPCVYIEERPAISFKSAVAMGAAAAMVVGTLGYALINDWNPLKKDNPVVNTYVTERKA